MNTTEVTSLGIRFDSMNMCRTNSGEEGYKRAVNILCDRFVSPYNVRISVIGRLKYSRLCAPLPI